MALADAPLVLKVSVNGRSVTLRNVAHRRIVSFRLGVVAKKGGSLKLIRVTSPIESEIETGQVLVNPQVVVDESKRSHKGRAELKVVEVIFEGGLVWRREV